MNLTKENVEENLRNNIVYCRSVVIVQNYEKVGNAIGILGGIIFPFVLGGIIALYLIYL